MRQWVYRQTRVQEARADYQTALHSTSSTSSTLPQILHGICTLDDPPDSPSTTRPSTLVSILTRLTLTSSLLFGTPVGSSPLHPPPRSPLLAAAFYRSARARSASPLHTSSPPERPWSPSHPVFLSCKLLVEAFFFGCIYLFSSFLSFRVLEGIVLLRRADPILRSRVRAIDSSTLAILPHSLTPLAFPTKGLTPRSSTYTFQTTLFPFKFTRLVCLVCG